MSKEAGPTQAVPGSMTDTLEDKLATMVWYLSEVRRGRRKTDPAGFESYLDDAEVGNWLDRLNRQGRIKNTRFVGG